MRDQALETELAAMVVPRFKGMTVVVEHSERWDRMCVAFRWEGFADLLPEERFHRLVQVIPEGFRASRLRDHVWLELAPGETVETFLEQPRSEDVAGSEGAIRAGLAEVGFFEKLGEALGASPDRTCPGDFSLTAQVLTACNFPAEKVRDAKLVFIRHGAYCDCQVLPAVPHELAQSHDRS